MLCRFQPYAFTSRPHGRSHDRGPLAIQVPSSVVTMKDLSAWHPADRYLAAKYRITGGREACSANYDVAKHAGKLSHAMVWSNLVSTLSAENKTPRTSEVTRQGHKPFNKNGTAAQNVQKGERNLQKILVQGM